MTKILGTPKATDTFVGRCENCIYPIRRDMSEFGDKHDMPCPNCGVMATIDRLYAVKTSDHCDGRCMSATGPTCRCGCGGANHGADFRPGTLTTTILMTYRESVQARKDAAQERAENRKLAQARLAHDDFMAWVKTNDLSDTIAWLDNYAGDNDFVKSIASQTEKFKILSERQVSAIQRARKSIEASKVRQAKWDAAKDAARPAPSGKVLVTGEVVSARQEDSDFGGVFKMLVRTEDGWTTWGSIPKAIVDQLAKDEEGYFRGGWGDKVVTSIRGRKVSFLASVSPAKNDPKHCYYSRPTKGQLL